MGRRLIILSLLMLGLTGPGMLSAGIIFPSGHDAFSLTHDALYREMVIRQDLSLYPAVGPLNLEQIKKCPNDRLSPAVSLIDPFGPNKIRSFALVSERLRAERFRAADDLPSLLGGMAVRPGKHVGALVLLDLDRAKAIDPDYTGKKYRGLAGQIQTAAFVYAGDKLTAAFGRLRPFWGPSRVNLLLSETTEPLDMVAVSYRMGRLTAHFLGARLDRSRPDSVDLIRFPGRTFADNRYLAAHRLDINLHQGLRVGLTEMVLFGGEGRPYELYYLNPLQVYHVAQLNENVDDNTIVGFDFIALPGKGFAFYGQAIIDDIQIDDKSAGDQEPNEIGLLVGLFKAGRAQTLVPDLKFEYVRLTNRTYHQRDPRNRYLYRNKPLGHPLGPDADSLSLTMRFWPTRSFCVEGEVAWRRHGAGSLDGPWNEPWLDGAGDYDEPFPTGTVEKAILGEVRARGYVPISAYTRSHLFITLNAGWGKIHNQQNIAGRTISPAWFDLSLTWLGGVDFSVE